MKFLFPLFSAVFFSLNCVCLFAQQQEPQPEEKAPAQAKVRELELDRNQLPENFNAQWFGREEVALLDSADALEKQVGADLAQKFSELVNWETEQIALVSWSTGGPPEGTLVYEWVAQENEQKKQENALLFFVQGPAGNGPRGMMLAFHFSFYIIPQGVEASLEQGERFIEGAGNEGFGGLPQLIAPGVELRELELDNPQLLELDNPQLLELDNPQLAEPELERGQGD